jgi:hypothetical protein
VQAKWFCRRERATAIRAIVAAGIALRGGPAQLAAAVAGLHLTRALG